MSNSDLDLAPSGASPWLDEFSIFLTSRSDRVYNNGRQQIEVTLLVVPAEGQTLTDAQYDSIGLAYQTAHGAWVDLNETVEDTQWFYQTAHDDRYDYYPSIVNMAVPVEVPGETGRARLKRLYVHSSAAAGASITLRGTLMRTPDTVVRTHSDLEPALLAEPSPTYSFPEDYHWQQKVRVGERLFDKTMVRDDRFAFEYALRPKNIEFSSAGFPSQRPHASHLIRWDDHQPSYNRATVVSVAFPHSTSVALDPSIQSNATLSERLLKQVITPNDGQVVVLVQGEPDVPRTLAGNGPHQPLVIEAYDRHGTLHQLAVDFETPENRMQLRVAPLPAAETQDISNITYFRVAGRGLAQDAARCLLYNNGYQQTYVQILLEAVDSRGQVTTIPESVLNNLTLVNYYTGEKLPSNCTASRTQSAVDKRFIYYQNQPASEGLPASKTMRQEVTFFIKTSSTQNHRVAAKLVLGSKTYHTYDVSLTAGDGKTVAGRSNTSAIVEAKAQNYHYDEPSFYTYNRIDTNDTKAPAVIDIDRYDLKFHGTSGHRIAYYGGPTRPFGWDYIGSTKTNWIHTFEVTGKSSIAAIKSDITQSIRIPDNAFCQARIKVSKKWTEGECNKNLSIRYWFQDENGNSHTICITSTDEMNSMRHT
ncbi:hypothetical protein P0Y43_10020 [Pseudomonas entomophila]|uniref:hypothetical protein n=1 Tax=Pseudomonas entomophila TaxID=312306 RepID=UPI0023D7E9E3|nr:hypothetical protein [Pseudomonas entomophila]MDF0731059.1 hypothetical protein [Pseudomonas entomophila]